MVVLDQPIFVRRWFAVCYYVIRFLVYSTTKFHATEWNAATRLRSNFYENCESEKERQNHVGSGTRSVWIGQSGNRNFFLWISNYQSTYDYRSELFKEKPIIYSQLRTQSTRRKYRNVGIQVCSSGFGCVILLINSFLFVSANQLYIYLTISFNIIIYTYFK